MAGTALGTLTIVDRVELGNAKFIKATLGGDGGYNAGTDGTAGLLAALKAALNCSGLDILDVKDISEAPLNLSRLEYSISADKLLARVKTTGVESAVDDQSALTYTLLITCK